MSQGFFIEALNERHGRKQFDCGQESLNEYLKRFARQNTALGSSRTYVAVTPDNPRVCGYFTLSSGAVALTDFPEEVRKGWPRLVPSVHLGRFAFDREFQGQRLGKALLDVVFERTLAVSQIIGVLALELWAIDEAALSFYRKFDFTSLQDDHFHLYLSLDTARELYS